MKKVHALFQFPQIVDLNVGGRHFTSSLSTLTKYPDSMLGAMFSGRHPVTQDKDGWDFIDVDGDMFAHILNFLRMGTMPPPEKASEVQKYAEYFVIGELAKALAVAAPESRLDIEVLETNKSYFKTYPDILNNVKQQIRKCDIKSGFILLQFTDCNSNSSGVTYRHVPRIPSDCTRMQDISFDTINVVIKEKRKESLMSVLANDLKKCGVYLCPDIPPYCNSFKFGRIFRFDCTCT